MGKFHDRMRGGSTHDRVGQHTNPVRRARREQVKLFGGIRKFKRIQRALKGTGHA